MAQSKATKKFEKRHLKDTIKKRKDFAKVKQRHQVNDKRKAKRANDAEAEQQVEQPAQKKQKQDTQHFQDMSVDDFFAGDFQIPEEGPSKSKKAIKAGKQEKKRKREEPEEESEDGEGMPSPEADPMDFEESDGTGDEANESGSEGTGTHMDDLKALSKKDPEFFKYLQENDAELLDFAENAGLDEVDELSGDEKETSTKQKKSKKDVADGGNISKATVRRWAKAMAEQHSLRSMREMVLAFRAAAHLNEEEGKDYKYTISNADVYHEVVVGALKHVTTVLNYHLPVKQLPNGKIRVSVDSKKFRTLTPLLKSHTVSVQHLLSNLSDVPTLKLTLAAILDLSPYILSFKKAVREVIRSVVNIWSSTSQDESVRISAFLILRRLAIISDAGIKETLLRTAYQGFIKGSRTTTTHNLPAINLMKNSALELWGLVEPNIAYTTGFTFIRQLAIHLRTSIKNNANDSYKAVYNWQYVHSLDFWSRVLSTHCETLREASSGKESPLRPLIYPLVQVTLGAMRLIPTSAYFPLRFQLIRALLRLSKATGTFIPLAAPLYEVLSSAEMKKHPKPSTLKGMDFETNIRAAKGYLRTRVYQDGVGEQVGELLGEFFGLWCKSVAFPELALPVVVMLRRWLREVSPWNGGGGAGQGNGKKGGHRRGKVDEAAKGNRNSKVNGMIVLLVQKLEASSRFIEERRAKIDFAPNDRAGVEGFLKEFEVGMTPLGAFVEGQRKQREERRRVVEEGRRDEEVKKRDEKKAAENEEMDGFEGSSDEGSVGEGEAEADEIEEADEMEEEFEDEEEPEIGGEEELELDGDEIEVIES